MESTEIIVFMVYPIAGYLLGSIPFGLIIGKLHGVDIRRQGSGNIGSTNVGRVMGKKWGYVCFLFDVAKGLLPVLVGGRYLRHLYLLEEGQVADAESDGVAADRGCVYCWSYVFGVFAVSGGEGGGDVAGCGAGDLAVFYVNCCGSVTYMDRGLGDNAVCVAGVDGGGIVVSGGVCGLDRAAGKLGV